MLKGPAGKIIIRLFFVKNVLLNKQLCSKKGLFIDKIIERCDSLDHNMHRLCFQEQFVTRLFSQLFLFYERNKVLFLHVTANPVKPTADY